MKINILYIGQYTDGTTSKMRADQIINILSPSHHKIIDIHIPFYNSSRVIRTLGFRFKKGPLIKKINKYIIENIESCNYDLIWVDKGIFITKDTTNVLRKKARTLVHFTPDMAFYENKSKFFIESLPLYDFAITTKTQEISLYNNYISPYKLIKATQGYDFNTHIPCHLFSEKENSITFIGLAETNRFEIIERLINNNIHVKVAGKGWKHFIAKHKQNPCLKFYGEILVGNKYAELISSSRFSIGMLSKRFTELHTTRTFEIPACGTALITERNKETSSFYNDDEAIFYTTTDEMIEKIKYYNEHLDELEVLTRKGLKRVEKDKRDYYNILQGIIEVINISN